MLYVGLDNARASHHFVVLSEGKVVEKGDLPNNSWAYQDWCAHFAEVYPNHEIVVGIEEGGGMSSPLDSYLQSMGWSIRQLTPEAVRVYRERILRNHNKTDDTDAYAMAKMLEAGVHSVEVNQERVALRRATRWRSRLVVTQTEYINELRANLALYWPETTEGTIFEDMTYQWVLLLLAKYPDPADIAKAGTKEIVEFLRSKKSLVPKKTIDAVVKVARQNICFAEDKPLLLQVTQQMATMLYHIISSKSGMEKSIEDLTKTDVDTKAIDEIRGISRVQAATFMAEVRSLDRFENEAQLASYAGMALKRVQTGTSMNSTRQQFRSNRRLKRCVLGIADTMALNEERSKAYYRKKIAEKKTHRQALRCLARHVIRRLYSILVHNRKQLLKEAAP